MDLYSQFAKFNIDTVGVCDAAPYNAVMNTDYKVCIVALFPYFCGYPEEANISIYAHGRDYHRVVTRILTEVAHGLELDSYSVHTDIGPEIDRLLCVNAGLCFVGRNGMCINDKYGSYFFIGYIACNASLKLSEPLNRECMGCIKCIRACPGGALTDKFCEEKCLSAITQKKGDLSKWEQELVKNNGTAFGCDICQRVCPHNEHAEHTPIPAFAEDRVCSLCLDELSAMSNKEFQKKYGDRAFSWRGKAPLIRNLGLLKSELAKIE